jgi:hypothetical protein
MLVLHASVIYTLSLQCGKQTGCFLFQLIAIGPTTAEAALSHYKLEVWSVASKPTPEYLLAAILK